MTEAETRALVALAAAALVTVWARRLAPTHRYKPAGYVHASTAAVTAWEGVPLHQHPEDRPGHLRLYRRSS